MLRQSLFCWLFVDRVRRLACLMLVMLTERLASRVFIAPFSRQIVSFSLFSSCFFLFTDRFRRNISNLKLKEIFVFVSFFLEIKYCCLTVSECTKVCVVRVVCVEEEVKCERSTNQRPSVCFDMMIKEKRESLCV